MPVFSGGISRRTLLAGSVLAAGTLFPFQRIAALAYDHGLSFGERTLAGQGGATPDFRGAIASASIVGGDDRGHWRIASDGILTPSAAGAAARLSGAPYDLAVMLNGRRRSVRVATKANTYSLAPGDRLADVLDAIGTAGGLAIEFRDGDHGDVGTIANRCTSEIVFRSQNYPAVRTHYSHRTGSATISGMRLQECANIGFEHLRFYRRKNDPASFDRDEAIIMQGSGASDGIRFTECEIGSSVIEKTSRGYNWPNGLSSEGDSASRNWTVQRNWIHDLRRGMLLTLDDDPSGNTNLIEYNYGTDCYLYALQCGGGSNITIRGNRVLNSFSQDVCYRGTIVAATSRTVTFADDITATEENDILWCDLFVGRGKAGPGRADPVTITAYDPATRTATVEGRFRKTPSPGDNAWVRDPSQAHQSHLPYSPSQKSDVRNIQIYGNVCGSSLHRKSVITVSGIKLDDLDRHGYRYIGCRIHGNVVISSQNIAMVITNGDETCFLGYNTIAHDRDHLQAANPAPYADGDMPNYTTFENNFSLGVPSIAVPFEDGVAITTDQRRLGEYRGSAQRNIIAGKPSRGLDPTYEEAFVGPSFAGIRDPLATLAPKPGGPLLDTGRYGPFGVGALSGWVSFPPDFESLPGPVRINGTFPDRAPAPFHFASRTAIHGEQGLSDKVRIGGVSAGTMVRLGEGSDPTAMVRILDRDGETVVRDWSAGRTTVDAGQFVQLRAKTASQEASEATGVVTVLVGTGPDGSATWTLKARGA